MFCESILLGASISAWSAFIFRRRSTMHGKLYKGAGIHKDAFIFFYLNGLLWALGMSFFFPITASARLLIFHLIRRAVECAIYTYGEESKMSVIQFIGGMAYYPLIVYMAYQAQSSISSAFFFFSAAQVVAHYLLFKRKVFVFYLHYFSEVFIHYSILQSPYNTIWLLTFSSISVLNRY